ncbi:HD domain-containing protein [Massilia phosphatilytica]
MVRALAQHLQCHPRFAAELSDENIELLYRSAPLHDIGKVGIPMHLLKPGLLDREEFEVMKLHAVHRPLTGSLLLRSTSAAPTAF